MRRSVGGLGLCVLLFLANSLAATAAPEPARIPIAVLPFANASGDAGQDYFADGITAEVAAALVNVPGLSPVARSSAFQLKGKPRDLPMLGRTLGSTYIVEGSSAKTGERVRVTARLVRAADGAQLWSETYEREARQIFDIEDGIAKSIAGAVHVPTGLKAGESLVRNRTTNMEAFEDYLRAKPLIRARGQRPFAEAAELLEKAVALDPNFTAARALLAFDYDLTPLFSPVLRSANPEEARKVVVSTIPRAEALARAATAASPKIGDAYVALAYAYLVQSKLLEAEDGFKQALAVDPNHPDGLHGYSQLLAVFGRIKESLAMRQRLQELEPFMINYVVDTAEIYWLDGDNNTAITMMNPFRPGRTSELAQVYASLGRYREAASVLREMNPANYGPGMLEGAAKILEAAPSKTTAPETLPRLANLGFAYIHAGAPERVMEYYESNFAAGYFQPISTTWFWHPSYAEVRKTERFKAFIRAIGLPEYWRARGWPQYCRPVGASDFTCP